MRHYTKAITTTISHRYAKRLDRAAVAHVVNVRNCRLVPVSLSSSGNRMGCPVQPGRTGFGAEQPRGASCWPATWQVARPNVSRCGSLIG